MTRDNLPAVGGEVWKSTLRRLMGYRGFTSPQKLERNFEPRRMSYQTIDRIIKLKDRKLGTESWDEKLAVLSGMLDLPVETLRLFYAGDAAAITRLTFDRPGGEEIRQFILDTLEQTVDPPRNRRASDRG